MEKINAPKLSSQSISYLLLCGGGIFAFILLAILPYKKALRQMDADIQKINAQIDEQKVLRPIFKDLLNRIKTRSPQDLPITPKSKLGRNDTGNLTAIFKKMAHSSNLRLNSVIPEINSFVDNTDILNVTVIVSGDFLDLRHFFLKLAQIPYLEHIEQVTVKTAKHLKEANFLIWMAQES